VLALLVLLGVLAGCGKAVSTPSAAYDLNALVGDLRAASTTVRVTQHQIDDGFAVKGQRIEVDGLPVFVYEFAGEQAMEDAASGVSADSRSITVRHMEDGRQVWTHGDWAETPYLYKKGRLIVITGEDRHVRRVLRPILDRHFAGGPWAFLSNN